LLTGSREDIDTDSTWNQAIAIAAVRAFTNAVYSFNETQYKYDWLRYIRFSHVSPFFHSFRDAVLEELATRPVLESWAGNMAVPSSLRLVPKNFADTGGVPFTITEHTSSIYVSGKYPEAHTHASLKLGVKLLSHDEFLQHLEWMIVNESASFKEKPAKWHQSLAETLVPLALGDKYKMQIMSMAIIPLHNGEWVCAQDGRIFFPGKLQVPAGVEMSIVDSNAANDSSRRTLFTHLGVKDCSQTEICQLIVNKHSSNSFNPKDLRVPELVNHFIFLFKARWRPPDNAKLWFATKDGGRSLGSSLYTNESCPVGSPLEKILKKLQNHPTVPFLHPLYAQTMRMDKGKDKGWVKWLKTTFSVETVPRLTQQHPILSEQICISLEFDLILRECEARDILLFLRDSWSHYSHYLEDGPTDKSTEGNRQLCRDAISALEITYRGKRVPLRLAVFPKLDGVVDNIDAIPKVDIPDCANRRWDVLGHLGIAVRRDISFYLTCLENMIDYQLAKKYVAHVYAEIWFRYDGNEELIRYVLCTL
jgi:hypothetical protein